MVYCVSKLELQTAGMGVLVFLGYIFIHMKKLNLGDLENWGATGRNQHFMFHEI